MSNAKTTQAVTKPEEPHVSALSLRALIARPEYAARFKDVLGDRAPQFVSSMLSVGATLRDANPQSIVASAMIAAALDLPVDKNLGFAHLVPYKGMVQFQIGYKGFIQLAIRTGQYRLLNACDVREGELTSFNELTGELVLDHAKRKSDKVVGYAAYFKLVNGYEHAVYWSRERVVAHAARYSQAYKAEKKDSPWFTNFDSMGKKTAIKDLLSHWGIMSAQLQRAIVEDQGMRRTIDADVEYIDCVAAPVAPKFKEPETFQAGSGASNETPPLPKTPTQAEVVDHLHALCAAGKITEAQVVQFMHSVGLCDESLSSFAEVNDMKPSALAAVVKTWPDVKTKIQKAS